MDNRLPDLPVNLPGIAKDLPKFPDYQSAQYDADGNVLSAPQQTADEMIAALNSVPTGAKNIPASAIYTGERYAYSFPYTDMEEMYAQQQGSFDKWKNGAIKFLGTATTTFLADTYGTVHGIGAMIADRKTSSFYNNSFNRGLDDFNKKMEDLLPNYYTQVEKEAAWYSSDNILTANFFADKILKNLGFSVGTIAGGFAWGAMIKATGLVNKLVRLGKGMEAVAAVEKAVESVPQSQRFGAVMNALNGVASKYVKPALAYPLINAERGIISATGTLGEASLEALQSSNEFRNKLIDDFKSTYGYEPSGADLADIDNYANAVGNYTWGMNVTLLTATNYIQLPKMLNSSKTMEKRAINNIIKEKVEKGATIAEKVSAKYTASPAITSPISYMLEKAGKPGRFVNRYLYQPAKLLVAPEEGVEEGMQYAIQTGTQDYYARAFHNPDITSDFWKTFTDMYKNVLSTGVMNTLSTKEGMEQVLIGMISGGIQTSFSPFGESTIKERGFTGFGGARGRNTELALKALNQSKNLTQTIKDGIKYANIAINSQIGRQNGIIENDVLAEKDYETDVTLSYIMPRVKYGKLEAINEELALYEQQAKSDEGYEQLKTQGLVKQGETREEFLQRLAKLKTLAANVNKTFEMFNDKYSAVLDDKGNRKYSDSAIEKMVYAVSKIADYDERLQQLSTKLGVAGLDVSAFKKAVEASDGWKTNNVDKIMEDTNADVTKILADIDVNFPTQAEDLKHDVLDFGDMLVKRNVFVNDFNDIKSSPEKYAEKEIKTSVEEETETNIPSKIKITTLRGEKEYSTNTPYFVGKPVEFTSENLFKPVGVYELVILGENKDGTIKIKDQNGEIRDISKTALEDFYLGEKSSLEKNKTANFYYRHKDVVYKYNFGKNWGGEKIGRLRYKDGKLFFVYLNSKGKIIEKQIDNSHFKAQGEFKQPRITEYGKVIKTKEQNAAQEAFLSEKQKKNLSEIKNQARDVLSELFDELSEKQTETENLINKKKNELTNIQYELKQIEEKISEVEVGGLLQAVGKKKLLRWKPSIRKMVSAANRLISLKQSIEEEIITLEAQKDDIEFTISYVMDYSQNIEELPFEDEDFFKELNDQVLNLRVTIDENIKEINTLAKLADSVQNAIDSAIDFISSLITEFEKRYPKVPLALGQEWIDFLKNNPNFLKRKPEYKEELKQLEEMIAQVEDVEIEANKELLTKLTNDIANIQKGLEDLGKEAMAKEIILNKFLDFANKYKEQKEAEDRVKKDKELQNEFLGTQKNVDTVETINASEKEGWEPAKKKDESIIWRATIGIQEGKDHQERTNRFGVRLPKLPNKENIKGVYITNKNKHLLEDGLLAEFIAFIERQADKTINPDEVIALVMVDDSGPAPVLVNEFGQPLSEEEKKDVFAHIVFQVFPLKELQWSEEYGKDSAFRSTVSEENKKEIKEHYAKFRERVLNLDSLELHEIEASFGIPDYEKTSEGENDYSKRNSVESVGLVKKDDFYSKSVVLIPTTNEVVKRGTTVYEIPISGMKSNLGRPFVQTPNGVVPLQNRQHTKEEASTIFNIIYHLAKKRFADKKYLSSDEAKNLLTFLRSVVYWGIPQRQDKTRKPDAYNGVYLDVDEKTGEFSLFVSGKGKRYVFSPNTLLDNKEEIISLLEGMYMNVNSSMAKNSDDSYDEIISIREDGVVKKRTWINYQAYLLSSTYLLRDDSLEEHGKERKDIPLTTIMRPLKDENDTNRKAIYFYTTDNEDDVVLTKKEKKATPPVIITPAGKPQQPAATTPPKAYVWDGTTVNIYQGKSGKKIPFTISAEGDITFVSGEDYEEIISNLENEILKKGQFESEKEELTIGQEETKDTLSKNDLVKLRKQANRVLASQLEPIIKASSKATTAQPQAKQEVPPVETDDDDEGETFTVDELEEEMKNLPKRDNGGFREVVERMSSTVEIENWDEVVAWIKQMLPNIPVYRVKRVIESTNGKQAWGMFRDGALYIYENAEVGTAYHEVFEAVWKMFSTEEEQQAVINEFKNRKGTFVDRVTQKTYAYNDDAVTPQMIKEQLAEEFRDYVRSKKTPQKPSAGKPYILKLFADLVSFIKAFFTGPKALSNTEQLFKNITEGKYKASIPYQEQLSLASRGVIDIESVENVEDGEFRERVLTDTEKYQIIQNMTYKTLTIKLQDDKSLFDDVSIRKDELYDSIKKEVRDDMLYVVQTAYTQYKNGKKTKKQYLEIRDSYFSLVKAFEREWPSIVDKHTEYLKSYSIEFDENDELQVTDENKTRESDYLEANKVDHIRKANKAVKLLLSTLPEVNEDGTLKVSDVGGAILMPMSKTVVTILNNVHNATDPEDMFSKLRELAKVNPNYRRLYKRLTRRDYSDTHLNLDNIKNTHGAQLITAFWKTFKKQNPEVVNIYIFDNGEVAVGEASLSNIAAQLKDVFVNDIVVKAKQGTNPYLKYDEKTKSYVSVKEKVANIKIDSLDAAISFLKNIGIEFDVKKFNKTLPKHEKELFISTVSGIVQSFKSNTAIITFSGKTLDINNHLLSLGYLQAKIENPDADSTFFNLNGDKTQSYIGTNPMSDLFDFLSQLKAFTLPEINKLNSYYSYLKTDVFTSYLNPNGVTEGSVILKKLFTPEGNRKVESSAQKLLHPVYVGGIDNKDKGKSTESSKLSQRDRHIQEINLNLKGYFLNLVPGDASMEWAIYLGNLVSYSNKIKQTEDALHIFREYFHSDFKVAKENRQVAKDRKTDQMRFFFPILGETLHNKVMAYSTSEEAYKQLSGEINKAIINYVNDLEKKYLYELSSYGVIETTETGYSFKNVDLNSNLTEEERNSVINYLMLNHMIAVIELHKLLYSDPYFYEDELKRIKNFSSPAQSIIHNSNEINSLFTRVWNDEYDASHIGYVNFNRHSLNTIVYNDVLSSIDGLEGYDEKPYKETDGQGIITLQAHKQIKIREGEWTDANERQYKYDMAWEVRYKAEQAKKKGDTILAKKYFDMLSASDIALLDAGNPKVKSTYTPIKPISRGNKQSGLPYNDILLDKYSLYPMSFRLLHDLAQNGGIEESNAMRLYNKMVEEKIDYVVFASGRKVGATKTYDVYNPKGEFNNTPYDAEGITNVPFHIFSIQAEVPSKDIMEVTRGTQITKLATMDFMEAGVPLDYKPELKKNFASRWKSWNALSHEQKKEASNIYKEISNNQTLLDALTDNGYRSLLVALGIREITTGSGKNIKRAYEVYDKTLAAETLREEFLKREINDNISTALQEFIKGTTILETTPAYQQVRNILYSIADKRVISQKMHGGMKVQVTSTLLESKRAEVKMINGKPVYTSDVLGFYTEDGKQVCELMVGRWFKSRRSDVELIKYFNETEEGQKELQALAGVAFRIPTQNKNSTEIFKIKQFLPEEFGDAVIVPSAIVQKAGSDFDIDKLTIYLKNVVVGKDGYPRMIKYLTDENSSVRERYYKWVGSLAAKQVIDYIKILSKKEFAALSERRKERLAELDERYHTQMTVLKDEKYNEFYDGFSESKREVYNEQEEALKELFAVGKNIFNQLPQITKDSFYEQEQSMKNEKGASKTMHYRLIVEQVLEDNPNMEEWLRTIFEDMVANYNDILNLYGLSDDKIDEIYQQAITLYRSSKTDAIKYIQDSVNSERLVFLSTIDEETEALKFAEAEEIAQASNLPTFEEFSTFTVENQNTKEALQNAYISSLEALTSHPAHFKKLVAPNSADIMKKLAKDIVEARGETSFDYGYVGNMFNKVFMSHLRHAFVTGKYAIGIAAVNQTNHANNQRQLVYIDVDRLNNVSDTDKYWLNDCSVKFKKVNMVEHEGKMVPTTSMIYDATGKRYISDIIGMFIDGYVDISKGPWIMELGAKPNVASTWLLLVKLGVPIESVALFMNQPIIRDYLKSIEKAGYSYLFMDSFVENELSMYGEYDDVDKHRSSFEIPDNGVLESTLGKKASDMSANEKLNQQLMLLEFVKYAKMAEHLFFVTQGMNADTANMNDPLLVFKKHEQLEKSRTTIFSDVDEIIENSFIDNIFDKLRRMRDALAEFLPSDKGTMRDVVETVLKPFVEMNDNDFKKLGQKVVADVFDYIIQVYDKKNVDIKRILIDNGGVSRKVMHLINVAKKDKSHPLHNNFLFKDVYNVLQEVSSKKADDSKAPKNIKIKALGNKVYDQNNIIFAFRELKDYLKKTDQMQLYDDLVLLAVLQSGVSNSVISFTSLIPYEDFAKIYAPLITRLSNIPDITNFLTVNAFIRNNWSNDDVVPYEKAQLIVSRKTKKSYYNPPMEFLENNIKKSIKNKGIPQVLQQDVRERAANKRFMVYSWEKNSREELTTPEYAEKFKNLGDWAFVKAVKNDMRKKGDFSYIKKGLFQRVEDPITGEPYIRYRKGEYYGETVQIPQYVYKAINAWGDSYRAKEFYDVDKSSVIDNGFIESFSIDDREIIALFEDKKKISGTSQPSATTSQQSFIGYSWARSSSNSYEVSSEGDVRFSALHAKLKDGRTIEEAYQLDVKGYRTKGNDWRLGKNKPPLKNISREQSWKEYKALWERFLNENPALEKELATKAKGKVLTDKFATTEVSQARALAELLTERSNVNRINEMKNWQNKNCK